MSSNSLSPYFTPNLTGWGSSESDESSSESTDSSSSDSMSECSESSSSGCSMNGQTDYRHSYSKTSRPEPRTESYSSNIGKLEPYSEQSFHTPYYYDFKNNRASDGMSGGGEMTMISSTKNEKEMLEERMKRSLITPKMVKKGHSLLGYGGSKNSKRKRSSSSKKPSSKKTSSKKKSNFFSKPKKSSKSKKSSSTTSQKTKKTSKSKKPAKKSSSKTKSTKTKKSSKGASKKGSSKSGK